MNRLKIFILCISICNLLFCMTTDNNIAEDLKKKFNKEIYSWSRSLAETFHLVNNKCYFPVTVEDAMIKAIDAFVHIDDYSHFLGPKDYKELLKTTSGEFYGIGVDLAPKKIEDDFLLVLDVIPESPAQIAGLKKYDKIIAIEDKTVGPLTIEEAVKKLQGDKRYSIVNITILRDSKTILPFALKRDLIQEKPIICYYLRNQNIFYCAITLFTQPIAEQLKDYLQKLLVKNPNPKGIILDLRDNIGGVLKSAVQCASLFLEKNSLIVTAKDRHEKIIEQWFTQNPSIVNNNIPIIILINNYTASAAEILAGALKIYSSKSDNQTKYNPYIFLLGTTTYGKGSVQEVIPVSNNCALKLTTCLYYLPDNSSIDSIGIEPDIFVEQKYPPNEDIKKLNKLFGREKATKKKHSKHNQNAHRAHSKIQKIELFKNDYQIQTAISTISLLNIALKHCSSNISTHKDSVIFLKNYCSSDSSIKLEEIK